MLRLRQWLIDEQVTVVGIEATTDYWKPVYDVLEDTVEVQLLNAAHMHNVPRRQTNVRDAAWIARLVEHGLVRGQLRPTGPIRRLRGLTRYRAALVGERSREKQRREKLLEDAGIKLSVSSPICSAPPVGPSSARWRTANAILRCWPATRWAECCPRWPSWPTR